MSVSGVLFSVGVCVCDLLIFSPNIPPPTRRLATWSAACLPRRRWSASGSATHSTCSGGARQCSTKTRWPTRRSCPRRPRPSRGPTLTSPTILWASPSPTAGSRPSSRPSWAPRCATLGSQCCARLSCERERLIVLVEGGRCVCVVEGVEEFRTAWCVWERCGLESEWRVRV